MVIDFHIHSKYSFDSFLEPQYIVDLARRHSLDGLAITDHDTMAGVVEFRRLAPDLLIIAGQEIITEVGDILGLFLKEEIPALHDHEAVIERIRSQGGLAVLAHPFKWPHLRRSDEILKKFDAIEVFNARNNIPSPWIENFKSRQAAERLHLSVLAGSDTHQGFELGCARTVFDFGPEGATDERIKEAIRQRRVKVVGREVNLAAEVVSHFSRLFKSKGRR